MNTLKRYTPELFVLTLALGCVAGWLIRDRGLFLAQTAAVSSAQIRVDLPQYKFINPPLYSETPKDMSAPYKKLASDIGDFVDSQQRDGSASDISVYFRNLNTAQWTGINEDDLYKPSSMLKVVAMMAALKLAETDPAILSEQLPLNRTDASQEYYEPDNTMTDGSYSLQSLIVSMIKNSDNDAFRAIVSDPRINAEFNELYDVFHLPPVGPLGSTTDFMSPKSFSLVFRVLYNSSIFSWGLSEQVLELLSQTTFTEGLVAGVPANINVAHKFGENTNELHDCGIIYYPDHPYLLCVMTKGNDLPRLAQAIAGVSRIVYEAVASSTLVK